MTTGAPSQGMMLRRLYRTFALVAVLVAACTGTAASDETPPATTTVDRAATPSRLGSAATTAAATWCGTASSAVDRKPDVERWSDRQIHVLYAIPADGADRFAELVGRIVTDVGAIDAWWQQQDPARRPRWDLHAFPGCATRMGMLDIRSVRLPRTAAAYRDSDDLDALVDDLVPLVGLSEKVLTYYDGPRSEPNICGTSMMAPVTAGRFAFAFLWVGGTCNEDLGAGGSAAATAVHELVHDLGAVALVGPPHGCSEGGLAGHVCDNPADLMFPYSSGIGLGGLTLDVGRDDYYGHSGTWWDVQDSAWLAHLPLRTIAVNVITSDGAGTVVSEPGTIDCPGTCEAVADAGAVKLVARPAAGSRLWSWSGGCAGWGACTVAADGDATVTAVFGPLRYRETVAVRGSGRVRSEPTGIDCGTRCAAWFAPGTIVRLTAKPAPGWRLDRWTGACRGGRAVCSLRTDRDATAVAIFARRTR